MFQHSCHTDQKLITKERCRGPVVSWFKHQEVKNSAPLNVGLTEGLKTNLFRKEKKNGEECFVNKYGAELNLLIFKAKHNANTRHLCFEHLFLTEIHTVFSWMLLEENTSIKSNNNIPQFPAITDFLRQWHTYLTARDKLQLQSIID